MKQREYLRARLLRKTGMAVTVIAKKLGVTKSSVSCWVRDIKLTKKQMILLKKRNPCYSGEYLGAKANFDKGMKRRTGYQKEGATSKYNLDFRYACGCMLYWCEGSKERWSAKVTNTDPDVLTFFVTFLRKYFSCKDTDFVVSVMAHLNNGVTVDDIHRFWLKKLKLPKSCLRKFILKTKYYPANNSRKNKHIYGGCTVAVHNTRIVQKIYGSIQKIFRVNKPEWLLASK
jgi:hypothetical protein